MPDNIKVDYGKKQQTHKHIADKETEWVADAEQQELKGPIFREFTIHIF